MLSVVHFIVKLTSMHHCSRICIEVFVFLVLNITLNSQWERTAMSVFSNLKSKFGLNSLSRSYTKCIHRKK